jgi:microcystin-dependent protein
MSDPFIGEIKMFAGNFAPRGWAFCDGSLLPISANTALFSLLGTTYGGDGKSTFALPDLRGRAPMHFGAGPGLTNRKIGEKSGTETVTLTTAEIPSHNHTLMGSQDVASSQDPAANVLAQDSKTNFYNPNPGNTVQMNAASLSPNGGNQPHENMQPFLAINYIIALQGTFPPRS